MASSQAAIEKTASARSMAADPGHRPGQDRTIAPATIPIARLAGTSEIPRIAA